MGLFSKKVSNSILILKLLEDREWHTNLEIFKKTKGWRFGGVIYSLKQKGVKFSKKNPEKGDEHYIDYWKIDYIPKNLDYSGKRVKIIKS